MTSGQRTRRANRSRDRVVWEPGPHGWRTVRARVPGGRAKRGPEGVPRSPEPGAVGGVEGYSTREVREELRQVFAPDVARRILAQLEDVAEATARAALVPVELVSELARKPGAAVAFVVWSALTMKTRKRRRKAKR